MRAKSKGKKAAQAEIFQQIRARRKSLGLTQEETADLAGCGALFVIHLEQGKPTVRLDKLMAVLDVLGMDLCLREQDEGAS